MAAGEYVSVYSQADAENADLARERLELATDPLGEPQELAQIYVSRGLTPDLADQVARQLMEQNALEANARDELGMSEALMARPVQAAFASAASFAVGASLPLAICALAPANLLIIIVVICSLLCLASLGALAARIGGASAIRGSFRVQFWGVIATGVTLGVGAFAGMEIQPATPSGSSL